MGILNNLLDSASKGAEGRPFATVKFGEVAWNSKKAGIYIIDVNMGINGDASTCVIVLKGNHAEVSKNKVEISSDFEKIKIGAKVEVSLGYTGKAPSIKKDVSPVFKGFVSDMEIEIDYDKSVTVTVTCMDGKIWLMASNETKIFKNITSYSNAIKAIYSSNSSKFYGLKVGKTPNLKTPIYMCDESYYNFCVRAAKITGKYFFVFLGVLYFIDLKGVVSKTKVISPSQNVRKVTFRASPFGIPKFVEVKSINDKDINKPLETKVSKVEGGVGSGKDTLGMISSLNSTITVYDETVTSVKEAQNLANSILEQRSLNLAQTELEIEGDPKIELASKLKLSGFGIPIDNSYVITGIQHDCNFDSGEYTTNIHLSAYKYTPQGGGIGGALSGATGALSGAVGALSSLLK